MNERSDRLEFRGGIIGAFIAPAIFLAGVIAYFVIFRVFDMNALTAAGLAGLLIAGLFAKRYSKFWDSVMIGVSSTPSITLLLILLPVSLISSLISQTGVSGGFVWLAGNLGVTGGWFVVVTFLMVCARVSRAHPRSIRHRYSWQPSTRSCSRRSSCSQY